MSTIAPINEATRIDDVTTTHALIWHTAEGFIEDADGDLQPCGDLVVLVRLERDADVEVEIDSAAVVPCEDAEPYRAAEAALLARHGVDRADVTVVTPW